MAWDYRSIMSGQRKDPLAWLARGVLRGASLPYGIAVRHRNRRYETKAREIIACGVPVISVGNITTGGTGKTPIVCMLAHWLRERGVRVAIVSRGYGRGEADSNDEALELHARLPDVPHVQDPDRVEAARIAVEELEAQVILMDDGFQHRRLHRDLNIVVIDATCPFGYGYLLPRGLLREPIRNLNRADLAILTRCDAVNENELANIEQVIRSAKPGLPIERSVHAASGLLEYPDVRQPIHGLRGEKVCVISAIGNPAAFEQTVSDLGATIIGSRRLPDHDPYSPQTVEDLRQWIQSMGSEIKRVICTHKDLVKLRTDRLGGVPLAAITIELQFVSSGRAVYDSLDRLVVEKIIGDDAEL
jgi:tetraacyldisaccharide 4'-kinase